MTDNPGQATGNQDPEAGAGAAVATPPQQNDWRSGLDTDVANHPSLEAFKSPADLAKSWVNAQKLIGADKIPVPGEKATPEEWNLVFDRLGRPKGPDGYQLPQIENLPEGFPEPNEQVIEGFKQQCHTLGILPGQAAKLYEWFQGTQAQEYGEIMQGREGSVQESETALRQEWGKAYEPNLQAAQKIIQQFGDDNLVKTLEETGLGNNPSLIKLLANIGKNFSEDGLHGKPSNFTMSPEEAKNEINRILADKAGAYFNRDNPEHKMMVQKMADLHAMAYPEVTQG